MNVLEPQQIGVLAALAVGAGVYYLVRSGQKSSHRRPPGPPGLPLLGNVLQVPGQVCTIFVLLSGHVDVSNFMNRSALGFILQDTC